jgi:hypothetical protein
MFIYHFIVAISFQCWVSLSFLSYNMGNVGGSEPKMHHSQDVNCDLDMDEGNSVDVRLHFDNLSNKGHVGI